MTQSRPHWPAARVANDLAQFIRFALRRFRADGLTQAAGALTYSTLLALVPLMVITFAILSGFPAFDAVKDKMEALFFGILVPEAGAELSSYLTTFTGNARNLTTFGVIGLAVTAVLLLSTIETTLNRIWRVERPRPMMVRLLIFWAVLTMGPLLLAASFTLTSDLAGAAARWTGEGVTPERLEPALPLALNQGLAVLAQSAFFTLLFKLVPARRVQLRHAALGGAISGLGFEILRLGFNAVLTSGSTYSTIYGAVAAIPIFLVWLYLSWSVIIFGAVFAAAFPDWWHSRGARLEGPVSPARRLEIAVGFLALLVRQGGVASPAQLEGIAPLDAGDAVLEALLTQGYLVTTDDDMFGLTRDLHRTGVATLARDLALSLGRAPATQAQAALDPDDAGPLATMLNDLAAAETRILDRPIAEILPWDQTA